MSTQAKIQGHLRNVAQGVGSNLLYQDILKVDFFARSKLNF